MSSEPSAEELRREVASLRVLVDFLIGAAPNFSTHYYGRPKLVGAKKAQVIVEGLVVEEKLIGGKMVTGSFAEDLAEAIKASELVRNG